MKKLVIILVIVGLSFLALLVYGSTRSEQSGAGVERPKGFASGREPNEEDLDDWDAPDLSSIDGLRARFASDLGIEPEEIVNSGLVDGQFRVARSDERARAAKITLTAGSSAILRGRPAGDGEESKSCLCRISSPMPESFNTDNCPKPWIKDHLDPNKGPVGICREGDEDDILPFLEDGGLIVLLKGPEARVRIE